MMMPPMRTLRYAPSSRSATSPPPIVAAQMLPVYVPYTEPAWATSKPSPPAVVESTTAGGLGFDVAHAGSVYGTYTGSIWAATIGGGLVADRLLGAYRSVLIGGIIIALGHFTLAFRSLPFFYSGLALIVLGTGLLKPNATTMLGSLYGAQDARRDAGFSIFYMGINLGAFIGPLIAGALAQRVDWHLGFACAGVGMTLGLVQYVLGRGRLQRVEARPVMNPPTPTTTSERATAADDHRAVLGFTVAEWMRIGPKEPSTPMKFAFGLLLAGVSFILLLPAGIMAGRDGVLVSPLWLVAAYFIQVMGELCLSPVGNSVVTKLVPARIVGLMMGVWFLSIAGGNKLAGWAAGLTATVPLPTLFGSVAAITLGAALILIPLNRPIRRLMGGVR